uniref:Uncharacterized protein n=1 Tax=Arundo donax TaxID=35708 RepID=A0A0A8XX85_ARUDO
MQTLAIQQALGYSMNGFTISPQKIVTTHGMFHQRLPQASNSCLLLSVKIFRFYFCGQ